MFCATVHSSQHVSIRTRSFAITTASSVSISIAVSPSDSIKSPRSLFYPFPSCSLVKIRPPTAKSTPVTTAEKQEHIWKHSAPFSGLILQFMNPIKFTQEDRILLCCSDSSHIYNAPASVSQVLAHNSHYSQPHVNFNHISQPSLISLVHSRTFFDIYTIIHFTISGFLLKFQTHLPLLHQQ